MTEQEKRELTAAAARACASFQALDLKAKEARLKQYGILADDGRLAERYGGPGRNRDTPQR